MNVISDSDAKIIAQIHGLNAEGVKNFMNLVGSRRTEQEFKEIIHMYKYEPTEDSLFDSVSDKISNLGQAYRNLSEALSLKRFFHTPLTVEEAKKFLKRGQHIAVNRSVYSHHAIYEGLHNRKYCVIEYNDYVVKRTSLEDFSDGDFIYVIDEPAEYCPEEIIRRALSRKDESDYNIFHNNCENFATWCRNGKPIPWDK
jgi:hypothetical protein